jgi:very-short-patch-repair endonuclease
MRLAICEGKQTIRRHHKLARTYSRSREHLICNQGVTGSNPVAGTASTLESLRQCARGNPRTVCAPQVQVGSYRVDFLFGSQMSDNDPLCLVAVECDGHEFHEKTKQQAARDKGRDRDLTSNGIKVFRFTGSEIWKNPGACADDVLMFLSTELCDSLWRGEERIVKEYGSLSAYLAAKKQRQQ